MRKPRCQEELHENFKSSHKNISTDRLFKEFKIGKKKKTMNFRTKGTSFFQEADDIPYEALRAQNHAPNKCDMKKAHDRNTIHVF